MRAAALPPTPLLAALVVALLGAPAAAQEPAPPDLTVAAINSRIAALDALALSDADAQAARAAYLAAIEQLRAAEESRRRSAEFAALVESAPTRLAELRALLSQPPEDGEPQVPTDATLDRLEQQQSDAERALTEARDEAQRLQQESGRRNQRQGALGEQEARAKQRLTELDSLLRQPAPADTAPAVAEARGVHLRAEVQARRAELDAIQAERASYEARRDLLLAKVDWARRREAVATSRVAAWQRITSERRQFEAERAQKEAEAAARAAEERLRREAIEQAPALLEINADNKELAGLRTGDDGLPAQLAAITAELTVTQKQLATLRDTYRIVRRKTRAAGVTNAMGQLLRKHLEDLPEVSALERKSAARQERMADVQYQLILREEQRLHAGDVERRVEEIVGELPATKRALLEGVAREGLTRRRDLLDALIGDLDAIFERLIELEQVTRQLVDEADTYRAFIEERILWVRSVAGSPTPDAADAAGAVAWIVTEAGWGAVVAGSAEAVRTRWPEAIAWFLGLALLLGVRPLIKRRFQERARSLWRPGEDSFGTTLEALVLTAVLALPLPVAAAAVAWALEAPADQARIGLALADSLWQLGVMVAAFEAIRQLLRPQGLAAGHFRWRSTTLAALRGSLRWFVPITLGAQAVVGTLDALGTPRWNDSLGRLAFVVEVIALSVFAQRVLRPTGPIVANVLQRRRGGWLERLRYAWYPLAVGLPIVLGALALRGYYYSALQLMGRLQASLSLVIVLVLADAVLLRWLRLARSRVILQQAEEAAAREEAAAAEAKAAAAAKAAEPGAEAGSSLDLPTPASKRPGSDRLRSARGTQRLRRGETLSDSSGGESTLFLEQQEEIDHAALSSRAQRLFNSALAAAAVVGLLGIWADVLPALKRLDQVRIYPTFELRTSVEPGLGERDPTAASRPDAEAADDAASQASAPGGLPGAPAAGGSGGAPLPGEVTLADLGLSVLILLFTFVAASNGPSLLEFLLLERVSLDAGTRYAISTVARYAIVLLGITFGFGAVGFRWNSIQWLAAALTFGLAFGLQEIFANFVSGLIILFERPIRLGDWVTVGEVTGVVSKIRIRATTITDRDRKELIVPNREFVTGEVINWSLSDTVVRVKVPVGVAYGTDPGRVRDALLEVAHKHERVLTDPRPEAFFLGFGDSTLDHELHVFVDHPIHQLAVRAAIHEAIHHAFAREQIEIAFPQRDLHLRSIPPGLIGPAAAAPPPEPPAAPPLG